MKIPYQMTAAVPLHQRYAHMESAIARGLPRLQPAPIDETATLHVACYGPSLADTWRELGRPLLSVAGATRWLADRGVVPDYHVDMDPRPNKVQDVTPPIPGVKYLMASVCAPGVFDALAGADVTLWHAVSSNEHDDGDWLESHDPHQWIVQTGTTVGLAALQIGGFLGFRHFEIHGMDASFRGTERHAGYHSDPKKQKDDITWAAEGITYRTSKIMANAAADTINSVRVYPIFCVFHGEGLTQGLLREADLPNACTANQHAKAAILRRATANVMPLPTDPTKVQRFSPWEALCYSQPNPAWLSELQVKFAIAEARRPLARFNTGSISLETGMLLRALCAWRKPRVIVEIGTFIGRSTVALQASEVIYTCDKDNDCLPSTANIRTHPYRTSTEMLRELVATGVRVDLFFFDGRLTDEDVGLVEQLSTPETLYSFDDYHEGGKGLANLQKLGPRLARHGFVGPHKAFEARTTLALLVPMTTQREAA